MPVLRPSDRVGVAGKIDPDAYATDGDYSTEWVDMETYQRILAVVQVGDFGTDAQVDAKLEQASDGSGTGAKDVTGKSITQLGDANSPTEANGVALINMIAEELDVANSFTHVRLTVTLSNVGGSPGGDVTDISGMILGMDPRHGKASDGDLEAVWEIVD